MKKTIDRWDILRIAAEAKIDPRTVKRAVDHGLVAVRTEFDRDRIRDAAKKLRFELA